MKKLFIEYPKCTTCRKAKKFLTENNVEGAVAFAKKINAYSINPYYKLVNEQIVKEIHAKNFKVFPWTVNQQNDIETLKKMGVDGIISDFPDRIS